MTNFALSIAYMREKALILTFFFLLLISISVMYQHRGSKSGINIVSSAVCSMFCVVMLPEDPSRKDREGSSDVDTGVMKRVSLLITAISLPLVFLTSWTSYLLVNYLPELKTDPDILLTFDQYWYIMSQPFTGLFILSILSCGWFALTYDKNNEELPQLFFVFPMKRWLKMIVDLLMILSTFGLLFMSVAKFPKGPNEVILSEEEGNGNMIFLRYGYTFQGINTTLQCTLNTPNKWDCGGYDVKSAQSHHNLSSDDLHIVYIGKELKKQDERKIELFPLLSKQLEKKLKKARCVTCLSESRHCHKIEQDFHSCEKFCTKYPTDSGIITHIKTREYKQLVPVEDLESISHPYKIGVKVTTQTNCSKPINPKIECLGNNQWKIPSCKGRMTLKMFSYQFKFILPHPPSNFKLETPHELGHTFVLAYS